MSKALAVPDASREAPCARPRTVTAISIATPAFNEAAGIRQVVEGWIESLRSSPGIDDFEIVVCNDGSRDCTGEILEDLARHDAHVKPVHHPVNRGAAAALSTAIGHTTLPWVLIMDADGQYGIENLGRMIHAVEAGGHPGAIGVRMAKRDTWFRRIGSRLSCQVCNWTHGTHYRDFFCSFLLLQGGMLRALHLEARGLNYSGDITSKLTESGVRLAEVEIGHKARTSGRSSATLRASLDRFFFVAYLGFRQFLLRRKVLQRREI